MGVLPAWRTQGWAIICKFPKSPAHYVRYDSGCLCRVNTSQKSPPPPGVLPSSALCQQNINPNAKSEKCKQRCRDGRRLSHSQCEKYAGLQPQKSKPTSFCCGKAPEKGHHQARGSPECKLGSLAACNSGLWRPCATTTAAHAESSPPSCLAVSFEQRAKGSSNSRHGYNYAMAERRAPSLAITSQHVRSFRLRRFLSRMSLRLKCKT